MKRKYSVNDNYFDEIDNQNKAYFFGLLYADGCNYEETGVIKIDLDIKDKDILIDLKNEIGYEGEIKTHNRIKQFDKNSDFFQSIMCRLSFKSFNMSKQLALKGMISNKSYLGKFPKEGIIREDLLSHFIRGYMDGNGSISYWVDNVSTGHKKFMINFCGASDIILNISSILGNKFNCTPNENSRFPDRDNNNLQCEIDGNNKCIQILDWVYKDSNFKLKRKYEKYLILQSEIDRVKNDTNLYGSAHPRRKVINLKTKEIYNSVTDASKILGYSCNTVICNHCKVRSDVMYLDEYIEEFGGI